MSASNVFFGPPLSPQRALLLMKEIAPLVIGRPLSLTRVEGGALSDGNGAAACRFEKWADGDVTLSAVVDTGDGNPRDGYGYGITLKLMSRYLDKPEWWRAEMNGGAWEPMLTSPIRVGLLGVTPADYEAIRARLVTLLPEGRRSRAHLPATCPLGSTQAPASVSEVHSSSAPIRSFRAKRSSRARRTAKTVSPRSVSSGSGRRGMSRGAAA